MSQANFGRVKIVRFNNPLLLLVLLPFVLVALFVLALIFLGGTLFPRRRAVRGRSVGDAPTLEGAPAAKKERPAGKAEVIDAEFEDITRA